MRTGLGEVWARRINVSTGWMEDVDGEEERINAELEDADRMVNSADVMSERPNKF